MRYLALIYTSEAEDAAATPEQQAAVYNAYNAFGAEVEARGIQLSGAALQPTMTATTVRVRDGKTLTTDGPFAETKEQLGGYYLMTCKDLNEAIEIAAKIPGAWTGSVEVRPVMEFPG